MLKITNYIAAEASTIPGNHWKLSSKEINAFASHREIENFIIAFLFFLLRIVEPQSWKRPLDRYKTLNNERIHIKISQTQWQSSLSLNPTQHNGRELTISLSHGLHVWPQLKHSWMKNSLIQKQYNGTPSPPISHLRETTGWDHLTLG